MKKQKKSKSKKTIKAEKSDKKEIKKVATPVEESEEIEIQPKKIITAIEIYEVDTVTEVDEKTDSDILLPEEEDDSFSPDDEEIDPFGDKWEQ